MLLREGKSESLLSGESKVGNPGIVGIGSCWTSLNMDLRYLRYLPIRWGGLLVRCVWNWWNVGGGIEGGVFR